jgi:hypothetical protein
MANQYQWLTWLQAQQALAARLADPNMLFWVKNELIAYLSEALRTWNALTEQWNADYAFTATSQTVWYPLSTPATSPRLRTLTDTYLYTLMEYHLLEPPSGSTWTGTSQFSISDLSGALQRRRDEMIQAVGCNLLQLAPLPSTPSVRRTVFSDSTLEPRRTRFIPDSAYGGPITLTREDTYAFDHFEPDHLQTDGMPSAWSVISGPPLSMDVDQGPSVPGVYDVLSLVSGPAFTPPTANLLGVPDDWSWLAKWGALADLLGRDSEATDTQRATYCLKRYVSGLDIMKQSNWILSATINGVPCDVESVFEKDAFDPEWENNVGAWPALVTAGMDLVAPCPTASSSQVIGVTCVLVGDAPIPAADNGFVQISRDAFDVILDYAQLLAMFKVGGAEFAQCKDLELNFYRFAVSTNKRLANMGFFRDELGWQGRRQDIQQPRDPVDQKKR